MLAETVSRPLFPPPDSVVAQRQASSGKILSPRLLVSSVPATGRKLESARFAHQTSSSPAPRTKGRLTVLEEKVRALVEEVQGRSATVHQHQQARSVSPSERCKSPFTLPAPRSVTPATAAVASGGSA